MDYSEEYRSQLVHGRHLRAFPCAVQSDDLRDIQRVGREPHEREPWLETFDVAGADSASDAYRAELSLADKLRILGGENCGADAEFARRHPRATAAVQSHDFESDSVVRTFVRLVLWRCECMYYLMLSQWIGQRVDSFKQKRTGRKWIIDRRCFVAR
jgi:hypothetical protein